MKVINRDNIAESYITVIKPSKGFVPINLKELWKYRELFFFLAIRNISIRYKQTVLGVAWAGIQPFLIMVVFSVIFGKVAKLPSGGIPYPLMVMAGTIAWQFFSTGLSQASSSILTGAGMVRKIYFPRLILPVSFLISSFIDFSITFIIFLGIMLYYGFLPTLLMLYLPLFLLLLFLFTLGLSLWFSALNVAYRDVKIMIPFLLRLGIYISPVGFLTSTIPEKYLMFYSLNPLVGIIDGFRWCLLGGEIQPMWTGLYISIGITIIILISGLFYFSKKEKSFADII